VAILTFPTQILKPRSFRLDIVGAVISGGLTQSGQQQVVNATGGGLWSLQMDFNRFTTAQQLDAWRKIQYGSLGGVVDVNIAVCDVRQSPVVKGALTPHSDLTPFSDMSLYSSPDFSAVLAANAPLRATSARMITTPPDAEPFGFFSLPYGDGLHELHFITSAVMVGDEWEVTFVPPLRAAHVEAEEATFGHPLCTMRLAQQDSMTMATEYGRFGTGQAAFIEHIPGTGWVPPGPDPACETTPFDFAAYIDGLVT